MEESRRRFLKASGALIGTGALASTAGCSQLPGGIPGVGGGGGGGVPGNYANWLYAPGTVQETDHYGFNAQATSVIAENEDNFSSSRFDSLESSFDSQYGFLGVDFDEAGAVMSYDSNTARVLMNYDVSREDVVGELEGNDYSDESEYSGYQVFVGPNEQQAVGVGDSNIVVGRSTMMTGGSGGNVRGNAESGTTQDLRSISYGESWQGAIDASDPQGYRGRYEPVTFQGTAGDIVTIDMHSGPGDTYLILLDPNGNEVARNDDFQSLNSRIQQHQLQSTGEYTIIATSFSSSETFPYTLTLTLVGSPIDPVSVVETIVDTQNGEEDRYSDDSEHFAELTNQLNAGTLMNGRTHEEYSDTQEQAGRFEGAVASGSSLTVNGETSDLQWVISFADSDDIDTGDIEDWTGDAQFFDNVDDINVNTNGRSAIITGTMDTDDI